MAENGRGPLAESSILVSFDIDGTLVVGDPPGILSMELVRAVKDQGCLVGSCSDRPISAQRAIWATHDIDVDFTVSKHMLPEVKARFDAAAYYHVGDREDLDKRPAERAGFEFLWPHEAAGMPWLEDGGAA